MATITIAQNEAPTKITIKRNDTSSKKTIYFNTDKVYQKTIQHLAVRVTNPIGDLYGSYSVVLYDYYHSKPIAVPTITGLSSGELVNIDSWIKMLPGRRLCIDLTYTSRLSPTADKYGDITCELIFTIPDSEVTPDTETDRRSTGVLSPATAKFGDTVTMNITTYDDRAYYHKITYSIGDHTDTIQLGASDVSGRFTILSSWMDAVPDFIAGTMHVFLETFDASTKESMGDPIDYELIVSVPESVVPSISGLTATAVNIGSLQSDARFFANTSTIKFELSSVKAGAGSTVKSVTYSGWGSDEVSNNTVHNVYFTATPITRTGNIQLKATVTDARGRTASTTATIRVYKYSRPYLMSADMYRCDANGTPNDKGECLMLNAIFGCDSSTLTDNTVSAYVEIKAVNDTGYLNAHKYNLTSGQDLFITNYRLIITRGYDLHFVVTDNVMSVDYMMLLPSSRFVLHFANNGKSIGIGTASEPLAAEEVGRIVLNRDWDVYMGVNIHIGNQTLAEYIQSVIAGAEGGEIADA